MAVNWIVKFLAVILVLSGWMVPVFGSSNAASGNAGTAGLQSGAANPGSAFSGSSISAALAFPSSRSDQSKRSDPGRQAHYALTARQVADALRREFSDSGLLIADEQVSLLADVVASEPDPVLDVKSVERISDRMMNRSSGSNSHGGNRIGDRTSSSGSGSGSGSGSDSPGGAGPQSLIRSKVKLACHVTGACLPFYAIVSWPAGRDGHDRSELTTARAASPRGAITMPAGAHATLLMDDKLAHIQLSVISLESGRAGDRIRVASPDRRQIYTAEVVSGTLLRGSF